MTSASLVAAIVVALAFPITIAAAQPDDAETLFREGRQLLKQGDVAAACDRFEASARLEASVGTLLNLGACREELGRLAGAWTSFRDAEALARVTVGDEARATEAQLRAERLEPRLAYLEIEVDSGARVDGLVITRDREIVEPAVWSTAVPIDPGTYAIAAAAPGCRPWTAEVEVGAGDRRRVIVVPPLPSEPPPEAPVPVVVTERPRRLGAARSVSIAIGALGLAGLGGSVAYGVRARDLEAQADQRCPGIACGDPDALRANDEAQRSAMRANVLAVGGGVAVIAAAVLWLAGAPPVAVHPIAGGGTAGIALSGTF